MVDLYIWVAENIAGSVQANFPIKNCTTVHLYICAAENSTGFAQPVHFVAENSIGSVQYSQEQLYICTYCSKEYNWIENVQGKLR